MQNIQNQDKRSHIRIPSSRPLILIVNKQNIYATMTDFSLHGIGFMAEAQPQLHSTVEIHFDLPEDVTSHAVHPFQFKAEVIHCIDCHESNHIGVRLELPTKEYMQLFDKLTAG